MRELLLKNQTFREKRRKIISVSESTEKDGFLAHTQRHFIYMVKEAKNIRQELTPPILHILKFRNSQQKREKLFFKVKGNFYVVTDQRLYIVYFCHSFKIELSEIALATPSNPL